MKVLDLNTLYIDGGEGGINTYLTEKARHLSSLPGVSHSIVVPARSTARGRLAGSTLHTVRSPALPGNSQQRILVDFATVAAILHEERPDVVEVDLSYVLGEVAARALKERHVPVVGFYHVHLPFIHLRPRRFWLQERLARWTEALVWRYTELCMRPCDRVVVSTRDMRARLVERGLPSPDLVPLGVNLDVFRPRRGPRCALPGVDPARPVVLHVGRLSWEKDLEVLLEAHRELSRGQESQLVIAGDGPLGRRTRRFARRVPGVVCLGACRYGEDIASLYRCADVLAVPSRNETFSLILLEALASGLPVVAARQGGPAEILPPGCGELADPGDPADFAAKLRRVLAGPDLGPACRRHVEAGCSWESTFQGLLEVYRSAIESRPRSRSEPPAAAPRRLEAVKR
jgi:alpha-1,6-mannosyltransferase